MSTSIPSKMRRTIVWTAAGLGAEGIFTAFAAHADVPIITATWTGMLLKLANQADLRLEREQALKIAAGIIVGVGGLAAGIKVANTWLAYTGVGTIPAMLCNLGTNAAMTYVIGCAAARVFLSADNRASVEEIIKAIVRIVRPGHPTSIGY